jgi:hypothetical protein
MISKHQVLSLVTGTPQSHINTYNNDLLAQLVQDSQISISQDFQPPDRSSFKILDRTIKTQNDLHTHHLPSNLLPIPMRRRRMGTFPLSLRPERTLGNRGSRSQWIISTWSLCISPLLPPTFHSQPKNFLTRTERRVLERENSSSVSESFSNTVEDGGR